MNDEDTLRIAVELDRLILETRLRDLSLLAQSDQSDRVETISAVISSLRPGAYLLGCGPYCCGVFPLTVDEVALGRPPSPLESSIDTVVDYTLNDAVCMVPREASRIHATVVRKSSNGTTEYQLRDENSSTGTYLNGRRLKPATSHGTEPDLPTLANGDAISLGPSGVNTYVFVLVD